jgi:hypothetical protein
MAEGQALIVGGGANPRCGLGAEIKSGVTCSLAGR